jgi:hypothetical protein
MRLERPGLAAISAAENSFILCEEGQDHAGPAVRAKQDVGLS